MYNANNAKMILLIIFCVLIIILFFFLPNSNFIKQKIYMDIYGHISYIIIYTRWAVLIDPPKYLCR